MCAVCGMLEMMQMKAMFENVHARASADQHHGMTERWQMCVPRRYNHMRQTTTDFPFVRCFVSRRFADILVEFDPFRDGISAGL